MAATGYQKKKEFLAEQLRAARAADAGPVALQKETSNLFRDRAAAPRRRLDVRNFRDVIEVGNGAVECEGMARVDFFLEAGTNRLYINEINIIPGFTSISMYPKLWAASGLEYSDLIDRLIQLGIERHEDKKKNQYSR